MKDIRGDKGDSGLEGMAPNRGDEVTVARFGISAETYEQMLIAGMMPDRMRTLLDARSIRLESEVLGMIGNDGQASGPQMEYIPKEYVLQHISMADIEVMRTKHSAMLNAMDAKEGEMLHGLGEDVGSEIVTQPTPTKSLDELLAIGHMPITTPAMSDILDHVAVMDLIRDSEGAAAA